MSDYCEHGHWHSLGCLRCAETIQWDWLTILGVLVFFALAVALMLGFS